MLVRNLLFSLWVICAVAQAEPTRWYLAPFRQHYHPVFIIGEGHDGRIVAVRPHAFFDDRQDVMWGNRQIGLWAFDLEDLKEVSRAEFDRAFSYEVFLENPREDSPPAPVDDHGNRVRFVYASVYTANHGALPSELFERYPRQLLRLRSAVLGVHVINVEIPHQSLAPASGAYYVPSLVSSICSLAISLARAVVRPHP